MTPQTTTSPPHPLRALLERLEGGMGDLGGRTVAKMDPGLVRTLLSRRVLIERPPIDEVGPSMLCQRDHCTRLVLETRGELFAHCPYGECEADPVDPAALRAFEVRMEGLCQSLRADNGWDGAPVREIATGFWWVGQVAPGRSAILTRMLTDATPVPTLHFAEAGTSTLLLVPATNRLTSAGRALLATNGIMVMALADALAADPARPFRLAGGSALDGQPATGPMARLVVDVGTGGVRYRGRVASLPSQLFKLLLILAREAAGRGTVLSIRQLEDALWGTAIHSTTVHDVARRLRRSLADVLDDGEKADTLIENRHAVGYRLALAPAEVLVIETEPATSRFP